MNNFILNKYEYKGHFKVAEKKDIPEINKLVNCCFRGEFSKIFGWTSEEDLLGGLRSTEKSLEKEIAKEDTFILLYFLFDEEKNQNEIVGCMQIRAENETLYLGMISIYPTLQNRGLGRILLKAVDEYAKINFFKKQRMIVISRRTELIEWYQRRGFKIVGDNFKFEGIGVGDPKISDLEFCTMQKEVEH